MTSPTLGIFSFNKRGGNLARIYLISNQIDIYRATVLVEKNWRVITVPLSFEPRKTRLWVVFYTGQRMFSSLANRIENIPTNCKGNIKLIQFHFSFYHAFNCTNPFGTCNLNGMNFSIILINSISLFSNSTQAASLNFATKWMIADDWLIYLYKFTENRYWSNVKLLTLPMYTYGDMNWI